MKFQSLLTDINQYPRFDEYDYFASQLDETTKTLLENSNYSE
jgi:hypothetical protein